MENNHKTKLNNTSRRSAKVSVRRGKIKRKPAVPALRIPITEAAQFFIAMIEDLDHRIMDEMSSILRQRWAEEGDADAVTGSLLDWSFYRSAAQSLLGLSAGKPLGSKRRTRTAKSKRGARSKGGSK